MYCSKMDSTSQVESIFDVIKFSFTVSRSQRPRWERGKENKEIPLTPFSRGNKERGNPP
mgnify:CR=1